ncbi:hypothetical protein [Macrococcoides canis]|uniref:hypothetical protein n=1 Tax=Macrococcoides canis TaxID=1855823 RepID=UPI00105F17B5|nr:hypothetical protein [Macrococcus canis]TDM34389.1 hypothetical protein ETI13_00990 [Macrococcus canis]
MDDVVKSRDYLNNRLMHIFDNPKNNTMYHLHGGSGDHHFQDYVQPFVERLKENNIKYDLNIENYNQHSDLATYFVPYLLKTLTKLTDLDIEIEQQPLVKISVSAKSANVTINISEEDEFYYAIYLYKVDEQNPVRKLMYQKSNIFNISDLDSGKYRTRIFIKDRSNNTNSYSVGRFIIK